MPFAMAAAGGSSNSSYLLPNPSQCTPSEGSMGHSSTKSLSTSEVLSTSALRFSEQLLHNFVGMNNSSESKTESSSSLSTSTATNGQENRNRTTMAVAEAGGPSHSSYSLPNPIRCTPSEGSMGYLSTKNPQSSEILRESEQLLHDLAGMNNSTTSKAEASSSLSSSTATSQEHRNRMNVAIAVALGTSPSIYVLPMINRWVSPSNGPMGYRNPLPLIPNFASALNHPHHTYPDQYSPLWNPRFPSGVSHPYPAYPHQYSSLNSESRSTPSRPVDLGLDETTNSLAQLNMGTYSSMNCTLDKTVEKSAKSEPTSPPKTNPGQLRYNSLLTSRPAEKQTSKTSKSNPPAKLSRPQKSICPFCRQNGKEDYYHEIKNELNEVTCPVLREYRCRLCGATGSKAHTIKYCQQNPFTLGDPVAAGFSPGLSPACLNPIRSLH